MDCFQDFCLACDKQSNGTYCSQSCRLADLERATPSTPTSPLTASQQSQSRLSWSSTTSTASSAYVLAPAYDFHDKASTQALSPSHRPQTSYFMRYPSEEETATFRSLTPSSSRSSLSSTSSDHKATSGGGMSQQARIELDSYFNSFSRAKAANRRPSLR